MAEGSEERRVPTGKGRAPRPPRRPPRRVLLTGAAGYIGTRLVQRFLEEPTVEAIAVLDRVAPRVQDARVQWIQADVRAPMTETFLAFRPDAAVHLAFVLNPTHDPAAMRAVNVGGARHFLDGCAVAGVQDVMMVSSVTAYGALPDNPMPLVEDMPLRATAAYQYAADKREVEGMCRSWTVLHPDRRLLVVRPAIVMGPNIDNFIGRSMTRPLVTMVRGHDPHMQLVQEEDVAAGMVAVLLEAPSGAYNLTPDDALPLSRIASLYGRRPIRVPRGIARVVMALAWALRITSVAEAPMGMLDFLCYPFVCSNAKVKRLTRWRPRFTTEDAVRQHAARAAARANG